MHVEGLQDEGPWSQDVAREKRLDRHRSGLKLRMFCEGFRPGFGRLFAT